MHKEKVLKSSNRSFSLQRFAFGWLCGASPGAAPDLWRHREGAWGHAALSTRFFSRPPPGPRNLRSIRSLSLCREALRHVCVTPLLPHFCYCKLCSYKRVRANHYCVMSLIGQFSGKYQEAHRVEYSKEVRCFEKSLYWFPDGCVTLHTHWQWGRAAFSPHPHQHFLFLKPSMTAILTGVRGNLSVSSACISPMAGDAHHFFTYLLVSCRSSFKKCTHFNCPFLTGPFIWGSILSSKICTATNSFSKVSLKLKKKISNRHQSPFEKQLENFFPILQIVSSF